MVSIVIPTYNRGYCLSRSINSILNQTYEDYELVVVDDGSDDNTSEVVHEFKDSRIKYIKLDENRGVSYARNVGMDVAVGDYIAFQDSDDVWLPEKLEKQLLRLKKEGADFGYTYIRYRLQNGESQLIPDESWPFEKMNGDIFIRLLWENMIGAPTLLIKRDCFENVGYFDTNMPALEDWDYVLRLAKRYTASFVPEALFEASYSEKSISRNVLNRLLANCMIIGKYKKDMMDNDIFNYQVNNVIKESQEVGILDTIVPFLEKCIATL